MDGMMAEAMKSRLDKMVEEGIITSDEAQQYKDWLAARPKTSLPRLPMFRGGPGGRFGPLANWQGILTTGPFVRE